MPSAFIVTRKTSRGRRFVVRYRLGGRTWPVVHGGSFRTKKEADARRDLIAGALAVGKNPHDVLRIEPKAPIRTLTAWSEKFIASRIDIDANTTKNYRTALKKVGETFGDATLRRSRWTASPAGWRISPRRTSPARSSCT
jgi:hypothetical protein